ncbi:unnamed protein product, partial [Phaeothamnion confervicola]
AARGEALDVQLHRLQWLALPPPSSRRSCSASWLGYSACRRPSLAGLRQLHHSGHSVGGGSGSSAHCPREDRPQAPVGGGSA